ncbi:Rho GTPase activating protein [Malassezia cuniculi]|uniref:Rho GTPase activating protein n=1 Tax=Malassezia cuniculi TaxID=948313 RepID=A0AAF0EX16_9BASI|nr:Rho GTPase activating protein [Malassezia cuniculi]
MTNSGRRRHVDHNNDDTGDEAPQPNTGFLEPIAMHDILARSSSGTAGALNQLLDQYNDLVVAYNSLKMQHNEAVESLERTEPTGLGIEGTQLTTQHSRFKLLKKRSRRSFRDSITLPTRPHLPAVERVDTPVSSASDNPSLPSSRNLPGTPVLRGNQTSHNRSGSPTKSSHLPRSPSTYNGSPSPMRGKAHLMEDDPFATRIDRDALQTATITTLGSVPNSVAADVRDRVLFSVSVTRRTGGTFRVDKSWSELVALHEGCTAKSVCNGDEFNAQLPAPFLFEAPYSPYRLLQRNTAVDAYLEIVRSYGAVFSDFLVQFLSPTPARATPENHDRAHRQGFMVQRGHGEQWHFRQCILYANVLVLRDPFSEEEIRIDLSKTRIGRQNSETYRSSESSNLHALVILETRDRQDVCYVLCAESDDVRDLWIDALVNAIAFLNAGVDMIDSVPRRRDSILSSPSFEMQTSPEASPRITQDGPRRKRSGLFRLEPSSPTTATNVPRRFWNGFRSFSMGHSDNNEPSVFGLPLRKAVSRASLPGDTLALSPVPAIVRRCIDFLEQRGGLKEEGIYRQSGSQASIRALAERFASGDFDLFALDDKRQGSRESVDLHSVSGLLKLYMRELPDSVLTAALSHEFLSVVESSNRAEVVRQIGKLMYRLPPENYSLLRLLCGHMNRVVAYSTWNKMTVKNICIIFSPSLVIPTPLLSIFLTEYTLVFALGDNGDRAPIDVDGKPIVAESSPTLHAPTPTLPSMYKPYGASSLRSQAETMDDLLQAPIGL